MSVLPVAAMAFDRAAAGLEALHGLLRVRPDRMRWRMAGAADVRSARTARTARTARGLAGKHGKIVDGA